MNPPHQHKFFAEIWPAQGEKVRRKCNDETHQMNLKLVGINLNWPAEQFKGLGSGCGSVGRPVASNTRGPQFESRNWQTFVWNICFLSTVLKRRKIKKNRPGMAHFKKQSKIIFI